MKSSCRQKCGFTLVETAGGDCDYRDSGRVALPAVQAAREAARRMQLQQQLEAVVG